MRDMRNAYKILDGKPEEKISSGTHKHRYGDNIRLDLRERGWENVDCITWLRIGTSGGFL
jgi:hypothetical protein